MKNYKIVASLFLLLFLTIQGKSQCLTQRERDSINWKIVDFLQHNVEPAKSVESEIILLIIQTDSTSKICNIHCLGDDKNHDKVYEAISKMAVKDFKKWNPNNLKKMSIIVPIYGNSYYPKNKNNYADQIFGEVTTGGDNSKIVSQDKTSILLSGILWFPNGKGHGDETKMK